MPETLDPATFDFDEWFADAHLPTRSADIFTRSDVLGRLDELGREIELADATDDGERSISQKSPSAQLRAEYERLAETFENSKITVYVQALTGVRRQNILDEHNKTEESDAEFMLKILSAAIVGLKKPGQDLPEGADYKPVSMSVEDVRKLYGRIGDAQVTLLRNAYQSASNAAPEVSADFLPGASSKADTNE